MIYKVISSTDLRKFEEEVNEYIKAGYILHGNISISSVSEPHGRATTYTQAMIKIEETK